MRKLVTKHLTMDNGYVVEYRVYEDDRENVDDWFQKMFGGK